MGTSERMSLEYAREISEAIAIRFLETITRILMLERVVSDRLGNRLSDRHISYMGWKCLGREELDAFIRKYGRKRV